MTEKTTQALALPDPSGVVSLKANAEALSSIVDVLPLTTPEETTTAKQMLQAVRRVIKKAEAQRKEMTAELNRKKREIDSLFRGPRKKLENLDQRLQLRINEAEERREAARLAAIAEAAVGNYDSLAKLDDDPEDVRGVTTYFKWEWEGYDVSQMPAEFLAPDFGRLAEYIKECERNQQEPKIPGVRFVRKAHQRVRT